MPLTRVPGLRARPGDRREITKLRQLPISDRLGRSEYRLSGGQCRPGLRDPGPRCSGRCYAGNQKGDGCDGSRAKPHGSISMLAGTVTTLTYFYGKSALDTCAWLFWPCPYVNGASHIGQYEPDVRLIEAMAQFLDHATVSVGVEAPFAGQDSCRRALGQAAPGRDAVENCELISP